MLEAYRFVINVDGYASVERCAGGRVHGVLWRLTPRDLAALNIYEGVDAGLYRSRRLVVRHASQRTSALVYIARPCGHGKPKPWLSRTRDGGSTRVGFSAILTSAKSRAGRRRD